VSKVKKMILKIVKTREMTLQKSKIHQKVSKVKFEVSNVKYLDRSYLRCPWQKCHKKTVKSQKITEQSVKTQYMTLQMSKK